jgi:vacuolar-type H+-ATPase subunit H
VRIVEEYSITREVWGKFLADNGLAYDSIKFNDGTPIYGWNIHHSILVEPLSEPIENRIQFIIKHKDESEQVVRLKNMRPVSLETLKVVIPALKLYKESIASALKLYKESTAPARKLYDESTVSARKICEESVISALKLYNESTASARKLYEESTASALKLYEESIASARKLLNESTSAAHLADVPNHTWNGESIF